ncbi:hypothetical protein ACOAOT_23930 [Lacrimispora sp. AGF001]|uniref:hypothetical protein n=1 Tax=Lacrimispora sp. AGF001 TaxID=3401631 RepID=UPI003B43154D
MAETGTRIGLVSSYNAETGSASIYYPDRNHEVTDEMPVFAPFGIIQTLEKDDMVLVLHLSNGEAAGIVMGVYSADETNEIGLLVSGGNLAFKDSNGSITLKEIIEKCREG